MSNVNALRSPRRRAHLVPSGSSLRQHRRCVAAWSMQVGRPVDRDALAAIVGATADRPHWWTTQRVAELLWDGIVTWCRDQAVGLPAPSDVRETLTTYLRYLSAHGLLGPDSDRPAALRRAIAEHGRPPGRPGADRRGGQRPPASVTPIA